MAPVRASGSPYLQSARLDQPSRPLERPRSLATSGAISALSRQGRGPSAHRHVYTSGFRVEPAPVTRFVSFGSYFAYNT